MLLFFIAILSKVSKIGELALNTAKAAFNKSSKQDQLLELSDELTEKHASFMDKSIEIPKYEIKCKKQTTCTSQNHKSDISNYKKAIAQVTKAAKNLIQKSVKGKALQSKIAKLNDLNASAVGQTKNFIVKNYSCQQLPDDRDEPEES